MVKMEVWSDSSSYNVIFRVKVDVVLKSVTGIGIITLSQRSIEMSLSQ